MNSIKQNIQPVLRTIIRKRVAELLKLHCDIENRIFTSRPHDLFLEEVPCGLVYYTSDRADKPDTKPRYYERTLELNVHFLNRWEQRQLLELVDDWFDSREFETITALELDYSKNAKWLNLEFIEDVFLVDSIPITLNGKGNKDIESSRIIFNIEYEECLNHLTQTELEELKSLYVKYLTIDSNPGDPDNNKKVLAEDNIILT